MLRRRPDRPSQEHEQSRNRCSMRSRSPWPTKKISSQVHNPVISVFHCHEDTLPTTNWPSRDQEQVARSVRHDGLGRWRQVARLRWKLTLVKLEYESISSGITPMTTSHRGDTNNHTPERPCDDEAAPPADMTRHPKIGANGHKKAEPAIAVTVACRTDHLHRIPDEKDSAIMEFIDHDLARPAMKPRHDPCAHVGRRQRPAQRPPK